MKKIVLFVISVIMVITLCSCGGMEDQKEQNSIITIHYNVGSSTSTFSYEKDTYLDFSSIDINEILSDKYYLVGWFTDSNYSTQSNGIRVANDTDIYCKLGTYQSASDYYFGKNIDSEKLRIYIASQGKRISVDTAMNYDLILAMYYQELGYGDSFYRIKRERDWGQVSITQELLYFPQGDLIVCTYTTTEKSSVSTIVYNYTYSGTIEFTLGQNISNAKIYGKYEQTTVNSYRMTIEAQYSANITFTVSKVNFDAVRLGDFNTVRYSATITDATDYSMAQKHFDKATESEKCYGKIGGAQNFIEEIFKATDNSYNLLSK